MFKFDAAAPPPRISVIQGDLSDSYSRNGDRCGDTDVIVRPSYAIFVQLSCLEYSRTT